MTLLCCLLSTATARNRSVVGQTRRYLFATMFLSFLSFSDTLRCELAKRKRVALKLASMAPSFSILRLKDRGCWQRAISRLSPTVCRERSSPPPKGFKG